MKLDIGYGQHLRLTDAECLLLTEYGLLAEGTSHVYQGKFYQGKTFTLTLRKSFNLSADVPLEVQHVKMLFEWLKEFAEQNLAKL